MNRRNFLRATMALAVSAALPLPALAIRPKPALITGEIGRFESFRWIQGPLEAPARYWVAGAGNWSHGGVSWSCIHLDDSTDLKSSKNCDDLGEL